MKYLIITPWYPYPEHKNGGVHTINNLINSFDDDTTIDLFYYYEKESEVLEIKNKLNYVKNIPLFNNKSLITRIKAMILGVPDLLSQIKYIDLNKYFIFDDYDAIIFDQIFSLGFLRNIKTNAKKIGMMHDNLPMFYERKSQTDDSIIRRLYDVIQKKWILKYEDIYFDSLDKIIYVSSLDAKLARKQHKNINTIDFINLGVNIPKDKEISNVQEKYSIVFSGVMDYEPNEDAAVFLITEVYPRLKEKYPAFELCIAGKNPTNKIKELARGKDIYVTGFVESMISTITQYNLYVSPLRFGSGMKNKVLEAMAAGMPVLLSDVSREGIDWLEDNVNCIFVDEDKWVEQIQRLFNDEELVSNIALNGKNSVSKFHSWKSAIDKFMVEG